MTVSHCKIRTVHGTKSWANVVRTVHHVGQTSPISTLKSRRVNILHVHRERQRTRIRMLNRKVIEMILTCEVRVVTHESTSDLHPFSLPPHKGYWFSFSPHYLPGCDAINRQHTCFHFSNNCVVKYNEI